MEASRDADDATRPRSRVHAFDDPRSVLRDPLLDIAVEFDGQAAADRTRERE